MKKNLLFIDLNWSENEVKLFDLFWHSLLLSTPKEKVSFDLLLITNYKFKPKLLKILQRNPLDIHVIFIMIPRDQLFERATLRTLDLFMYTDVVKYEKALHVRPETIVLRDINRLFAKKIEPGLIYSYTEASNRWEQYDHNSPFYGLQNYNQEEMLFFKKHYIKTWNSSIYMMVPDQSMKEHFGRVQKLADKWIGRNVYSDQCYMNFYFNMLKRSNTKLLNGLIESRNIKTNIEGAPTLSDSSIDIKVVLINFCGLAYFDEKVKRMMSYIEFLQEMRPCMDKVRLKQRV